MPDELRPIDLDEIALLATGAWILGAGGGGNPYHAYLNVRELYREGRVVEVMTKLASLTSLLPFNRSRTSRSPERSYQFGFPSIQFPLKSFQDIRIH